MSGGWTKPVIGIFGAGQLGRMLAIDAHRLGIGVEVYTGAAAAGEPDGAATPGVGPRTPTGQVVARQFAGGFDDDRALRQFLSAVDVATFEFENVPSRVGEVAAELGVAVRPSSTLLHNTQNRARERDFLQTHGFPVAANSEISRTEDLHAALARLGTPAILKTADFGYDGKGQVRIEHAAEADAAHRAIGGGLAILEEVVPFAFEASVVVSRGLDGATSHHGLIENRHVNHILDVSVAPFVGDPKIERDAVAVALAIAEAANLVGVMAVEFFVLANGALVVNELAPRVHNSGHLTIEACVASQFQQQIRAVAGLPLGDGTIRHPAAMANLLGDLWPEAGEPNWAAALRYPGVSLHLYGKAEARAGRKMGHLTAVATTPETAVKLVTEARRSLETTTEGRHG